jgi:hypothetical protein
LASNSGCKLVKSVGRATGSSSRLLICTATVSLSNGFELLCCSLQAHVFSCLHTTPYISYLTYCIFFSSPRISCLKNTCIQAQVSVILSALLRVLGLSSTPMPTSPRSVLACHSHDSLVAFSSSTVAATLICIFLVRGLALP